MPLQARRTSPARFPLPDDAGDPVTRALEHRDLERLLRVLDDCARTPDLATFRETAVEALARYFGYRHTTFFVGPTLSGIFKDRSPVAIGIARRGLIPYMEEYHRLDPFHLVATRAGTARVAVPLALDALPRLTTPGHRRYLEDFLFPMGIHAKVVVPLSGDSLTGGIGLLAEDSSHFGPRDLAVATLLSRHLGNLFALYADRPVRPTSRIARLTPRQAEVVSLVARGMTNRDIAAVLCLTDHTVKKHVTSAMRATGCANRTRLALLWLREGPEDPLAG